MSGNGSKKVILVLALLFALSGAAALLVLRFVRNGIAASTTSSEFSADTEDRSVLQANTGTFLPAAATDVHGHVDGFRDVTTHLRFTIPAGDLASFMKTTACTTPLASADIRSQLQGIPARTWWSPERAEKYASCTAVTDRLAQLVFVDMTDSSAYIVYVIASTR